MDFWRSSDEDGKSGTPWFRLLNKVEVWGLIFLTSPLSSNMKVIWVAVNYRLKSALWFFILVNKSDSSLTRWEAGPWDGVDEVFMESTLLWNFQATDVQSGICSDIYISHNINIVIVECRTRDWSGTTPNSPEGSDEVLLPSHLVSPMHRLHLKGDRLWWHCRQRNHDL